MDRMSLWFSPPPEEKQDEESRNTSSSDSDCNADYKPDDDTLTEIGSVGSLALLKRNKRTSERPIRMLELCYVGLVLLGEPVLCSDLIRFVGDSLDVLCYSYYFALLKMGLNRHTLIL